MTRHSLPVCLLLMLLLGTLLAPPRAGAQDLPAATTIEGQSPVAKSGDGRIAVTRSDGSTGLTRPTDKKEIRKLVGYMRDGMNRADRADRTEKHQSSKKVIRRIWIKK
jgi:hypothetical protein